MSTIFVETWYQLRTACACIACASVNTCVICFHIWQCLLCSLVKHLEDSVLSDASMQLSIPLAVGRAFAFLPQMLLLPHVLFSVMFHKYRSSFDRYIQGSSLSTFWEDMVGNPQYEDHPVKARDTSKAVPLSLHGDGVASIGLGKSWQKSFEAFSWSSLTGDGHCTLLMNWLIWIFPKDLSVRSAIGTACMLRHFG